MTDDSTPRKPLGLLVWDESLLGKMPDSALPKNLGVNLGLTQPPSQPAQASEPAPQALLWGHWRSSRNPDWVLQLRPAAAVPPIHLDPILIGLDGQQVSFRNP